MYFSGKSICFKLDRLYFKALIEACGLITCRFMGVFLPVGGMGMAGPGGGLSALMGRPGSAQSTASEP